MDHNRDKPLDAMGTPPSPYRMQAQCRWEPDHPLPKLYTEARSDQ